MMAHRPSNTATNTTRRGSALTFDSRTRGEDARKLPFLPAAPVTPPPRPRMFHRAKSMPGRTKEITGPSLFWFLARRPSTSNENKHTEKNQSTREALNSLCADTFSVVDDQQTGGRLSADFTTATASMSYDDDDDWNDNLSDDDYDDDAEDDSGSLAGVNFISDR